LAENFWALITNYWTEIKRQMEAYQRAVTAAREAHCHCKEPKELCNIWDCICVAEYIAPNGKDIEIEKPAGITSDVVDTFHKHPFKSKLLSLEAKETSDSQLQKEIASATAACQAEEAALHSTLTTSTSDQRRHLSLLAKGKLVFVFCHLYTHSCCFCFTDHTDLVEG